MSWIGLSKIRNLTLSQPAYSGLYEDSTDSTRATLQPGVLCRTVGHQRIDSAQVVSGFARGTARGQRVKKRQAHSDRTAHSILSGNARLRGTDKVNILFPWN